MTTDSKDRMVRSAYALFRERGYSGTGFREVSAHSGVTRGSIYHHFPEGKRELAEQVIHLAEHEVSDALDAITASSDAVSSVAAFVAGWTEHLRAHDLNAGCSIAAVVAETQPDEPQLAAAAAAAFGRWQDTLAAAFRRDGISPARARRLATLVVTGVEGALLLCRAERSTRPIDDIGRELQAIVRDATQR
jgi:AcrR family transcriptional regulator